jgi:hypothetical protein
VIFLDFSDENCLDRRRVWADHFAVGRCPDAAAVSEYRPMFQ